MNTKDNLAETMRGFTEESRNEAIKNLGGNHMLYEKYFTKFTISYKHAYDEIKALIEAGEINEARIEVHSLKGLAATLGLLPLSQAAAELEKILRDETEGQDPLSTEKDLTASVSPSMEKQGGFSAQSDLGTALAVFQHELKIVCS